MIWAKSKPRKSLIQHTQDVVDAAVSLFGSNGHKTRLGNEWLRFFGLNDFGLFVNCTIAAAVFHDLGKAERSWQESLTGISMAVIRHEHLSSLIMEVDSFKDWIQKRTDIDWDIVVAAIISHHLKAHKDTFARPPAERAWLQLPVDDPNFLQFLNFIREKTELTGNIPSLPKYWNFDDVPNQFNATTLRDRFQKRLKRFERTLASDPTRRRLLSAVRAALIAADAAGSGLTREGHDIADWISHALSEENICTRQKIVGEIIDPRVEELNQLGKWHDWSEFQNKCTELPKRTLLLAPCGSGKTLAAWKWISAQLDHCPAGRVIFLYPTRATAKEGFRDYVAWAPEADAALMHGQAAYDLDGMFAAPPESGESISTSIDPRSAKDFEIEQRLFALGFWQKRIFSATVDQFLSFLQYNYGAVCMLPVLADAVVVIDEVHSFDRGMFSALKEFLKNFDVPVLCMTATLTSDRIEDLRACGLHQYSEKEGDLRVIAEAPRYLVTTTDKSGAEIEVRNALANGDRVLWVVNTVRRAQELVLKFICSFPTPALITQENTPLYCYHSRFRLDDRKLRHDEVVRAFKGESKAALGITTQVCEMSLDLDADLLVTERCPVTSLIQRMGRCNRQRTPRTKAGRVLIYEPDNTNPYDEDILTGLDEFLSIVCSDKRVNQVDLEQALSLIPLPPARGDKTCSFLQSGAYAKSGEETFRDIDEFTVSAVLDRDLQTFLKLRDGNQTTAGLVLPVPCKLGKRNHDQLPNHLALAKGSHYDEATGFWDNPISVTTGESQ